MDDELHDFEAELKRLRPSPPSRDLIAVLERDLSPSRTGLDWRRCLKLWPAAILPVAAFAAILGVVLFQSDALHRDALSDPGLPQRSLRDSAATRADALKPVMAENILMATSDEGLLTLEDGTPVRRERRQSLDTITWKNARTNASLTWSVPREEVRVVPVTLQ